MDKAGILQVLPYIGARQFKERNDWIISSCPFAPWKHDNGVDRNPSFQIKVIDGQRSEFHCWSCSSHGDLIDLYIDLIELTGGSYDGYDLAALHTVALKDEQLHELTIPDYDDPFDGKKPLSKPFPEKWLASFPSVLKSTKALFYLKTRNVKSTPLIELLDLRFDQAQERICFPIRDFNGTLLGLHGRYIIPPKPEMKYHVYKILEDYNPLIWVGEQWLDFEEPILLVESVFDLASALRVYKNSACSLTIGMATKKVKRMQDAIEIVTLYDFGNGGDRAREKISEVLSCPITHLTPTEDQGDAGNMTVTDLINTLDDYLELEY